MENEMIYTVKRIDEDLDFGCEERQDDEPVMAVVILTDPEGNERRIRVPDQSLYQQGIQENDQVAIAPDGSLKMIISAMNA